MIKAERKKWAIFIFDLYLKRLLKNHFSSFVLINEIPEIDNSKALVVIPNHFSWWDGFFVYHLMKLTVKKNVHIMMLEEQLRRYWFFQKIGCYSVNPQNPSSSVSSIKYSLELLSNPENSIVIFPQGEIEPYEKRPVTYQKGVETLCNKSQTGFDIIPIAFKIYYTNEKLPSILVRCGKLSTSDEVKLNPSALENDFQQNLIQLDSFTEISGRKII